MKKLLFVLALSLQTAFVFGADKTVMLASARYENVKMYRQPGTSTEVLKALTRTDEVVIVRKYNNNWSIVTSNGQVGYMLTSELGQAKPQSVKLFAKK